MMVVHDFDFHPEESTVRVFTCEYVPRLDDDVFVARARYDNIVLHHYAWTSSWFKVNLTTNLSGEIVETPPSPGIPPFAFNIDVTTPMQRDGRHVFAVDLFVDVLVRADGLSYVVGDQVQAQQAALAGLISSRELHEAQRSVGELLEIIKCGSLVDLLSQAWPLEAACPGPAPPMRRVPLAEVPILVPGVRSTW
jgi:hypothetical protein